MYEKKKQIKIPMWPGPLAHDLPCLCPYLSGSYQVNLSTEVIKHCQDIKERTCIIFSNSRSVIDRMLVHLTHAIVCAWLQITL